MTGTLFPLYSIPAGTPCRIRRVGSEAWRKFTTTKDLDFEEEYGMDGRRLVFVQGEWEMSVSRASVVQRGIPLFEGPPGGRRR